MKFYDIQLDVKQVLSCDPVVDKTTGEIRKIEKGDKKGWTKYGAEILIRNGESFDVETVKFSSKDDPNLTIGTVPTIENLRLMYWSSDTGSGITFLADSVSTNNSKPVSKSLKEKITA